MDQDYQKGQKVQVTVQEFTPLGVVVTFGRKEGLIYNADIFSEPKLGETITAYIKEIREDGKIDMTFRKHGYKNFIETATETVLRVLKENNGKLGLSDKSSPEDIYERLDMSKAQFKKAIGRLYKERKIKITESGISKV